MEKGNIPYVGFWFTLLCFRKQSLFTFYEAKNSFVT